MAIKGGFIFKASFQPSELSYSVGLDYYYHNHPALLIVVYNLQCIFTYWPWDPHSHPWCDLIQSWFPSQDVKLLQDCFLIFVSNLDCNSQLVYLAVSKKWSSHSLFIGLWSQMLVFFTSFIHTLHRYFWEPFCAGLRVCLWDIRVSETVEVSD